jgi:hypothetical protein
MVTVQSWPWVRELSPRFFGQDLEDKENEGSRTKYQHIGEYGGSRGCDLDAAGVGAEELGNSGVFEEVPDVLHHVPQQLP